MKYFSVLALLFGFLVGCGGGVDPAEKSMDTPAEKMTPEEEEAEENIE